MSLCAAFDSAAVDWCALYASTSDAPNLFGATGLDTSALRNRATGAGAAVSAGTAFSRYSDERAKYGKGRIVLDTGTTSSVKASVGYNGTTFDYSAGAPTTLTGVAWVRLQTGTSASTFRLDVAGPGANVTNGPAVTLTTAWQRLAVTHTWGAGTGGVYLEVRRVTGTDDINVEIAGTMLVSGSVGPTYLNGGADTLLGVLTEYWGGGKWGLGFVKPYQYVAPVGKAELTLMNSDKRFSPEYASGPLFGELLPNRLLQIGDPDYGIWWTGWVDSWSPEAGTNRNKRAKLSATDARRFLDKPLALLPLQESTAANTLVSNFMLASLVEMPNTTAGIPAASGVAVGWDAAPTESVAYYGDGNNETDSVSKIVGDVVGGVQGKFWMNRNGQYTFTAGQGDDTPASYVDIAQEWLDLGNIEIGMIVNDSNAKFHVRKSDGSITLWELDETITLGAGESETIRAYFTNSGDDKILTGARSTGLSVSHTASGLSTTSSLLGIGAQSTNVLFDNLSGGSRTINTASITGTRIISKRTSAKNYTDASSKTAHGLQTETLDFNWVQTRVWAKRLVRYRVNRFKDARYEVPWLEYDVNENPQNAFDCWVGAAVHVEDDQTDHDDYYAVIGELHTVRDGLTDHTVKLYLEPLYPTTVASTSI